ncbi:glycosyltransferase, partial [Pediococcus argentinicus]|uniref:glycosyltransferase n=1 Tax=Pediococcus argentinicus TaxID=480391 RepID=UPI001C9AD3BE
SGKVYYFLNTTIPINKSGIEHAQIKRVNLFNRFDQPSKIVTRNFDPDSQRNLQAAGINPTNHVNLFDFLQRTENFKNTTVRATDIKIPSGSTRVVQGDGTTLVNDAKGRKTMLIETWPNEEQVSAVNYYDYANNLLRRERFDHRGFMSMAEIHNPTGATNVEQVFSPTGKLVYESFYTKDGSGEIKNSLIRVVDYNGQDYEFTGIMGLQRFFFDELNRVDDGKNVFIADRATEMGWSLLHMETKAFKVLFLHSAHTSNPKDIMDPILNNNFDFSLRNFKFWNGVINSTHQQSSDLAQRFGELGTKIYTIPVGVVSQELMDQPPVDFNLRTPGKIIVVARLFPEKRLDHIIKAFQIVNQSIPFATLDIWGYGDGVTDPKLKQQVQDSGLSDSVFFKGYSDNIAFEMDQAQLSVLTSTVEGFALAVLEAQSHGIPVVSYDIPYGPSDIIQNDVSGKLVPDGDYHALAQAMIDLLSNDDLLQKYSEAAYQNRTRFDEATVWQEWQALDDDAQAFFGNVKGGTLE